MSDAQLESELSEGSPPLPRGRYRCLIGLALALVALGCETDTRSRPRPNTELMALFGTPSVHRDPDAVELAYLDHYEPGTVSYDTEADFNLNSKCSTDNKKGGCATLNALFKQPVSFPGGYAGKEFLKGNRIFNANWLPAPRDVSWRRDGLGPAFDAVSCAACHRKNGRGRPYESSDGDPATLVLRISVPGAGPDEAPRPHPLYGNQLNQRAVEGAKREGRVTVSYEERYVEFADGETVILHEPRYSFTDLAHGRPNGVLEISPRLPPPVIGLGLVEAVPENAILAGADPEDADGDGISGRANYVYDRSSGVMALGRFGWKAGAPSLRQQAAAALSNDMGISSSLYPEVDCPDLQVACPESADGGNPEILDDDFEALLFYMQMLSPTGWREAHDPVTVKGEALFHLAGCTDCHTPWMKSDVHLEAGANSHMIFHPYSDFLLHDMGDGLADNRPEFLANEREWRTPPLWGLGLTEQVNGHTFYLHDGRARSLMEAILWHEGEGAKSRNTVLEMSKSERDALVKFLESL